MKSLTLAAEKRDSAYPVIMREEALIYRQNPNKVLIHSISVFTKEHLRFPRLHSLSSDVKPFPIIEYNSKRPKTHQLQKMVLFVLTQPQILLCVYKKKGLETDCISTVSKHYAHGSSLCISVLHLSFIRHSHKTDLIHFGGGKHKPSALQSRLVQMFFVWYYLAEKRKRKIITFRAVPPYHTKVKAQQPTGR